MSGKREEGRGRSRQRVRVYCRLRPPLPRETSTTDALTFLTGDDDSKTTAFGDCNAEKGTVTFLRDEVKAKQYRFDGFIPSDTPQAAVYQRSAQPVVKDFMCGYNGTIFAYGQTGTGKTYTMLGKDAEPNAEAGGSILADSAQHGIIPRAFADIFKTVAETSNKYDYRISLSYVQIYCELITDLLGDQDESLAVREDTDLGVYIDGVTSFPVHSPADCLELVHRGHENRVTASTRMNSTSSRSHAVLLMNMERRPRIARSPARRGEETKGEELTEANAKLVRSTLFMVDLAGSERVKKSGVAGIRFNELRSINLSLSALGNCIGALASKKKHVPYRDSKLTRLLQGSLGGNAKTALVITVGPEPDDLSETQSTLDFGQRARKVQVRAVVNQRIDFKTLYEDMRTRVESESDTVTRLNLELQALRKQVEKLQLALTAANSERADMAAEARVVAMSIDSAEALAELAEGDDSSPAAMVARIKKQVLEEMEAMRKSHRDEVEGLKQRHEQALLSQRLVAEEAVAKVSGTEVELGNHKDELLDIMVDYRKCRERLTEVEEDLSTRVGDLSAELDMERKLTAKRDHELELAATRIESAENALGQMMERVKADFVSRSQVQRMQKLYEDSIEKLTLRVDQLEAANKGGSAGSYGDRGLHGRDTRSNPDAVARRRSTSRERLAGLPPRVAAAAAADHRAMAAQRRGYAAGGHAPPGAGPAMQPGRPAAGGSHRGGGSAGSRGRRMSGGGGGSGPSVRRAAAREVLDASGARFSGLSSAGSGGGDGTVDPTTSALLGSLMSFKDPGQRSRAPGSVLARGSTGAPSSTSRRWG